MESDFTLTHMASAICVWRTMVGSMSFTSVRRSSSVTFSAISAGSDMPALLGHFVELFSLELIAFCFSSMVRYNSSERDT
eukprot:8073319-Pyramimonas_sp.AAC.1